MEQVSQKDEGFAPFLFSRKMTILDIALEWFLYIF